MVEDIGIMGGCRLCRGNGIHVLDGDAMNQWDREEESLERAYEEGRIDMEEFNEAMRDLQRDRRYAAHEAAQEAYDNELDRW